VTRRVTVNWAVTWTPYSGIAPSLLDLLVSLRELMGARRTSVLTFDGALVQSRGDISKEMEHQSTIEENLGPQIVVEQGVRHHVAGSHDADRERFNGSGRIACIPNEWRRFVGILA